MNKYVKMDGGLPHPHRFERRNTTSVPPRARMHLTVADYINATPFAQMEKFKKKPCAAYGRTYVHFFSTIANQARCRPKPAPETCPL